MRKELDRLESEDIIERVKTSTMHTNLLTISVPSTPNKVSVLGQGVV